MRSTYVLLALFPIGLPVSLLAGEVTATGTVESVCTENRIVAVFRKTTKGEKSGMFKLSDDAAITIDGEQSDLDALGNGDSVTLTYDTTMKRVVKVEGNRVVPRSIATNDATEENQKPVGTGNKRTHPPKLDTKSFQKKFAGKATYSAKTGELTLTYNFKAKSELKDFQVNGQDVVAQSGTLWIGPGDSIEHTAKFDDLKVTGVFTIKTLGPDEGAPFLRTSSGITCSSAQWNGTLQLYHGRNKIVEKGFSTEAVQNMPVQIELLVSKERVKMHVASLKNLPAPIGDAVKSGSPGRIELLGGKGGMGVRSLVISGKPDENWVKELLGENSSAIGGKEDEGKRASSRTKSDLEGNWTGIRFWDNGTLKTDDDFWRDPKTLSVDGNRFTLTLADGTSQGTIDLDETKKPAFITLKPDDRDGTELRGVFQRDGNELAVCWISAEMGAKPQPSRPTALTPADGISKWIFHRQTQLAGDDDQASIVNGPLEIAWDGGWGYLLEMKDGSLFLCGDIVPGGERKRWPKPIELRYRTALNTSTIVADKDGSPPIHFQCNLSTGEASQLRENNEIAKGKVLAPTHDKMAAGQRPSTQGDKEDEADSELDLGKLLTRAYLKKKFAGRASFNPKTAELTLAYDFANKKQLSDFELGDTKPVLAGGVLTLEAAATIRHIVEFKTLTVTGILRAGGTAVGEPHLATTSKVRVYGNGGLIVDGQGGQNDIGGITAGSPTYFTLTITEKRLGFEAGTKKGGLARDVPKAGQLILGGGGSGNQFSKLTLTGTMDDDWANRFFAE